MNKKDLKLIGEFIDKGNPKIELNYALVGRGGVYATDTRKTIKFYDASLNFEDVLVHKKILNGFCGVMGKDDIAKIIKDTIFCNIVKMSLDTAEFEFKYPDMNIIDIELPNHFQLNNIRDILFELTQRYCFVEFSSLYPLIAHDGGNLYDIFYKPQDNGNNGIVKIVAHTVVDEEDIILYTAVIAGRVFETKGKE